MDVRLFTGHGTACPGRLQIGIPPTEAVKEIL